MGGASVEAAYRGETGKMCAIRRISDMPYRTETEMVDVQKVANLEKRVPDDWISPDGMHVTEALCPPPHPGRADPHLHRRRAPPSASALIYGVFVLSLKRRKQKL